MPTPGYVFRDGGTTPPAEDTPNSEFRQRITQAKRPITATAKAPLGQATTTSHQLAVQNHDLKGAAQEADTLVGGISNEDLWMLIRRFDKQMSHVKAIPEAPPGGLDINIADDEEFSPIKLRANIERLYMTVIVGVIGAFKQIVRLRSWREPRRTSIFCAVYFLSWLMNLLLPALLATIILLITVPQSRSLMFPPAPIALIDSKTGGIQSPKAGVLGSHDSVTGAPEKYKGEAVEQEASNLVNSVASVALSSAAGRHDPGEPPKEGAGESKVLDKSVPDPTNLASSMADAADSASGGQPDVVQDKTKKPMEDAIWSKMRPAMHVLGDIADGWERFGNALSPTPPFDDNKRLQLAAIFAPMFLMSLLIRAQWVFSGTTFLLGVVFFTDPLQQQGIAWLNENYPDWPKYLEIRNTLLKGVPTNAQLTITLLRIGEANRAPIPPPPSTTQPPPDKPAELDKQELLDSGLDATHSEIEDAITVDHADAVHTESVAEGQSEPKSPKKHGFGAKVLSAFKHTTAAGVETKLTSDQARAALGSGNAKQKIGILPSKREMQRAPVEGPVEFKGRYKGHKGAVYVDSSVSPATKTRPQSPCVYFTTDLDGHESVELSKKDPVWALAISDIAEVKKFGGLGWKGRIIVGWATNREIKDGLEIVDETGKVYHTTALAQRDELFNRLVSMGQQVWEAY